MESYDKQGLYHITQEIQWLYKKTEKLHMKDQEIKGMHL